MNDVAKSNLKYGGDDYHYLFNLIHSLSLIGASVLESHDDEAEDVRFFQLSLEDRHGKHS
jgi:hypothetical protein